MKVLVETPAYRVVDGKELSFLKPDDELYINGNAGYIISDVMSFALKNGECPIVAYELAKQSKHNIYYIMSVGSCITSQPTVRKTLYGFNTGDVITYAGKKFEIVKQLNNNYGLNEVI